MAGVRYAIFPAARLAELAKESSPYPAPDLEISRRYKLRALVRRIDAAIANRQANLHADSHAILVAALKTLNEKLRSLARAEEYYKEEAQFALHHIDSLLSLDESCAEEISIRSGRLRSRLDDFQEAARHNPADLMIEGASTHPEGHLSKVVRDIAKLLKKLNKLGGEREGIELGVGLDRELVVQLNVLAMREGRELIHLQAEKTRVLQQLDELGIIIDNGLFVVDDMMTAFDSVWWDLLQGV